jgi:hypothetical protein
MPTGKASLPLPRAPRAAAAGEKKKGPRVGAALLSVMAPGRPGRAGYSRPSVSRPSTPSVVRMWKLVAAKS